MTVPGRALVTGDAGRVTGERQERADPEVPGRGAPTAVCRRSTSWMWWPGMTLRRHAAGQLKQWAQVDSNHRLLACKAG
jgi:hypothetical protein